MPLTSPPPQTIPKIPFSAPLSDILSAFDRDGLVVLSSLTSAATLKTITAELSLPPTTPTASPLTALASKSPTLCNAVLLDTKLQALLDARLCLTTRIWHGEERLENTSRPLLSATAVFEAAPGSPADDLHRHDDIFFGEHPLEQPVEIWALLAVGEEGSTAENGAVEAVLGSHRWGEEWDLDQCTTLSVAEMAPGDCLLLHGSTVHRGGANRSSKLRRTLGVSWTQGHLRQEENQYLNISKETAKALPEHIQRLIGYKINAPFGGWYELRDPITYLQPEETVDKTMRDFAERDGEEIPV